MTAHAPADPPMTPEAYRIRPATVEDLPALVELYNHYVRETAITFDLEPFTVETRRPWFDAFDTAGPHRLLVGEEQGRVVGYASSGTFRSKKAYLPSVETSIYLAPDATGRGLGTRLYAALFDILAREDVHRAYAGVTLPNAPSIAVHERFGFRPLATFHEVGRKFGRYWDVLWMEKALD